MIVTFTDFGFEGPYLGQMRSVLYQNAPGVQVIDLMVDAPAFDVRAAAYLLPRVMEPLAKGTVCLAIVDPGVGGTRKPIVLEANERWFIGPDNGLFELLVRQSETAVRCWEITYRPETVSASFHGRDIFAHVAAMIANGDTTASLTWGRPLTYDKAVRADWTNDWVRVIYIDWYGNCMTGLRWNQIDTSSRVKVGGIELTFAKTFSDCPVGNALCYQNSLGLVEFAINQGNAAEYLGLGQGSPVSVRMLSDK